MQTIFPHSISPAWGNEAMNQRTPGMLLGLGAIAVCLGLRAVGALEGLELAVHDRLLGAAQGGATGAAPVVLVAIREEDFGRYGYPISDALLAEALQELVDAGAVAVGVDLYRDGPAGPGAEALQSWAAFETVVSAHPQIVTCQLIASGEHSGVDAPDFALAHQVGFNNLLMDPGRFVRRGYLFAWDESGAAHTSLSLQLALRYLARERVGLGPAAEDAAWVQLGSTVIPPLDGDFGAYVDLDAGGYQFPLDYMRRDDEIPTLSFGSLLEGSFDPRSVEGRVVVVGTDSPSVKDDFNSPTSREQAVKGFRIHAHVVDQLIRIGQGSAVPRGDWSGGLETAWVVAWGLAGIGLSLGIVSLGWAVPAFGAGLMLLFAVCAALFAYDTWVPVAAPALAWASAGGVAVGDRARREAREQRQLMSLFRRFSSRRVADTLWRQRDEFMEGGRPRPQRVTLTALLSDLKGYTAASEQMEPDQLMSWIGEYMDVMTRVIESHEGHVDDYVGDGIKANFGVPIPSPDEVAIAADARRAVRCALEMGEALERLNAQWSARGWPTGRQRVGLFTGEAVVGSIGSEARTKYTSVGDTINSAARLEGVGGALDFDAEEHLQRILIGERTHALIGDSFEVEDQGLHALKGKAEPLRIYRVWGAAPEAEEEETR